MIRDVWRMAWGSLRAHRVRAALSLVGVVIGVASVVAVSSIAESGTANLRRQWEQLGLTAINVYPEYDDQGPLVSFTPRLVHDLPRLVPGIRSVVRRSSVPGSAVAGPRTVSGTIQAVEAPLFAALDLAFAQGRPFDAADEYRRRLLVVLGADAARALFPQGDPVGHDLMLQWDRDSVSAQVAGVLRPKDSSLGDDWNRSVLVSYRALEGNVFGAFSAQSLVVVAAHRSLVLGLTPRVKAFFADRTGRNDAVYLASALEWAQGAEAMTATSNLLLAGVSAISLLVGGIGVMNIMLVSVSERKKEIGIRKALGATPGHLQAQFLAEAVVLTTLGGVVGLAVGFGVAAGVATAFGWPWTGSLAMAALAVGMSMLTGVFFGYYPAVRAARLDPVEALAAE